MTKANDNVYPVVLQHGLTHDSHVEAGLTKRELFAAMAMQGLLSDNDYSPYTLRNGAYINTLGEESVKYADVLIAELNKEVQS